jgi:hypothetical protein
MSVQLQNMLIGALLTVIGGIVVKIFSDAWSERSRQKLRCSVQWFELGSLYREQLSSFLQAFDIAAELPNVFYVRPTLFRVKVENPPNNEECEIEFHIQQCLFYQEMETQEFKRGQDRQIIKASILPSRSLELIGAFDDRYGDILEKVQLFSKGKHIYITPLQFRWLSERGWARLHFIARNSHWLFAGLFLIFNLLLLLPVLISRLHSSQ